MQQMATGLINQRVKQLLGCEILIGTVHMMQLKKDFKHSSRDFRILTSPSLCNSIHLMVFLMEAVQRVRSD
jgi:hypothetical protein